MLNALHVSSNFFRATWKINAFLLNCMNMSSFLTVIRTLCYKNREDNENVTEKLTSISRSFTFRLRPFKQVLSIKISLLGCSEDNAAIVKLNG